MGRTVGGHARVDGPPPKKIYKKICAFLMRRRFTRFRRKSTRLRGPSRPHLLSDKRGWGVCSLLVGRRSARSGSVSRRKTRQETAERNLGGNAPERRSSSSNVEQQGFVILKMAASISRWPYAGSTRVACMGLRLAVV